MADRPYEYPAADTSAGIRVLHVDDDPDVAELTAVALERERDAFTVVTETDPRAGLDRIREDAIDCVVSDYEMPDMTGLEFLEGVRGIDPDVPFVLFTGKGSEEIASEAISAGVTDYIQKRPGMDAYTVLANRIENAVDQYRSRQALAESQRRLSRFIDQSPLGTIVYDETFTIRRVNAAAESITGYEAAELVGGTWLPIVPPEVRRHVAEVERRLLADKGGYHSVNEIVTKSGERRLCSWHNRVVTDADGTVITIVSQFEDVTERRRQRRELEETNAVLSTLFDTLPVGVLAEDVDRTVLAVNERLFEILEMSGSPAEAAGADCQELAAAVSDRFDDPEGFLAGIDRRIADGEPVEGEEIRLADGRTVARSYRPIELPDGRGHLWVYQDVTDRKRHERRLETLSETSQQLMTARTREAVAGIAVAAARDVLDLEANAVHLHDEDREGLVPVAATDALRELVGEPPTFAEGEGIAWRAYESGESISIDDVREDADVYNPDTDVRSEMYLPLGEYGVLIAGSESVEAFADHDRILGEILAGNVATALEQVDRTETLREHERELVDKNERLEEFTSVASHDLRNPLNVAQGRLELAMAECDSEHLAVVDRSLDRMETLIEDLLTLAREDDADVDRQPIALSTAARRCWETIETTDATLAVETDRAIRADEGLLRQILENLLANSVEHGGESVRIEIGELSDGDDGTPNGFYVADDGPGIPEGDRERVFEYGFSGTAEGTGFGLSIVDKYVEAHGWDVRVTESETGGARFEITGVEFEEPPE
ncbi:hybrid sensor histidine kinase/response regulator [Halopenitus persicus]|uniref:histidine kinase n=1 Tax=Halopenitus persicus TaxID=1048396 RepID=A0A1H3N4I6_9EURY|nr:PAS domain S-box protein [Halopenitus persicus]SDY83653.1 PAS domain S-box-containing protein [Halopenitus persicus]